MNANERNKSGIGKYQIPSTEYKSTGNPVETLENNHALTMKPECGEVQGGPSHEAAAWICSYEYTFCEACSLAMKPSVQLRGELVRRPIAVRRVADKSPLKASYLPMRAHFNQMP